jgi:hypothetical protein
MIENEAIKVNEGDFVIWLDLLTREYRLGQVTEIFGAYVGIRTGEPSAPYQVWYENILKVLS